MKKTTIIVMLAMVALLVVAGCSGSAESSDYNYDFVPIAGAGCGFQGTDEPVALQQPASSPHAM